MTETNIRAMLRLLGIEPVGERSGNGWIFCHCPFAKTNHKSGVDRNPSFTIRVNNTGLSGFNCFSCKEHGRLTKLVRRLEEIHGKSYQRLYTQTALAEIPMDFGDFEDSPQEYDRPMVVLKPSQFKGLFVKAWSVKRSRAYLKGRGISQQTAELLDLLYDAQLDRVLFPVYGDTRDKLYGFAGRAVYDDPTIKVKDYAGLPKDRLLLGEHLIQRGKPAFVVEGLFAFAHLVEIGARAVCNPLAVLGSFFNRHKRDILVNHDSSVILCFDDDLAGDEGLYGPLRNGQHSGGGAIDQLREHLPTRLALYPKGVTDVDNFTLQHVMDIVSRRNTPVA